MNPIESAYINALLADAAYVGLPPNATDTDVIRETKDRLTPSQAAFLAANFTVKDFKESKNTRNPDWDPGFDAVLWEGKTGTSYAGQLYVSMRGTQGNTDILDDVELASMGVPYDQIIDMVNWWMSISTPKNKLAPQIGYEMVSIGLDPDGNDMLVPMISLVSSVLGVGKVNNPIIAGVNGHSLGGYLATAFTRLFGSNVQSVSTYNSAGFPNYAANNIQQTYDSISQLVGVHLGKQNFAQAGANQTNYFAENGWSLTTNTWGEVGFMAPGFWQYGARKALNQEEGFASENHSIYRITDFLAVGAALEQLSPTLSIEQLNAMAKVGSNSKAASNEGLLDGVRRIVLGTNVTATPASDTEGSASRSIYHANLSALTKSDAFKALAGKVTLSIANASIETSAKTDFGAFLSLLNLSTIVVSTGNNTGATDALKAVHLAVYTDWVTDKNARLYGDTSRRPTYTDNWYADRAALLQAMVTRNEGDFASGATLLDARAPVGQVTYIHDATHIGDTPLLTAPPAGAGLPERHIFFGSDGNDSFTGYDGIQGDHLYGGGGDDRLDGRGGSDYLEGGTGNDTYVLQTGSGGIDTVFDAAGTDILQINGIEVNGVFYRTAGVGGQYYYSADNAYQLRPLDDAQNTWRLSAKDTTSGQYASVADLVGWTEGQFGITTGTSTQEPTYSAVLDYSASSAYFHINALSAPSGVSFEGGSRSDSFAGSPFNDRIVTGDGLSSYVLANGGDDLVVGGSGRDFIRTGANSTATGGTDNDVAYGGGDSDVLMGGAGDDQLWGGYDDDAHLTAGADSGERGDWITAESGNDTLVGSNRSDVLFGGAGEDIVHGGAGADLMLGDARYAMFSRSIGLLYASGTTFSLSWDAARETMVVADSGNYALNPVAVASGNAFSWTWGASGVDDFTLANPAGLLGPARVDTGGGADKLLGGDGNDWMAGQTGNDSMLGGNGDDLMYGDDKAGLISETDSGKDLMWGEAGNDRMFGGGKDDVIDGGAGNDALFGETGNDFMLGGDGDDDLSGNEGDDLLDGGAGDDRVLGGEGNDTLFGGLGKDKLEGGVGNDTYVFAKGDDAGVISVVNDIEGVNTLSISGSALETMKLTGSDAEWTLRYSQNDTLQLSGNFQVNWAGQSYSMTEFVQVLKDAVAEEKMNSAPTGTITLTGTATENETLSASSTLADADGLGSISYQWFSGVTDPVTGVTTWSAIDGATGADFTLTANQVGKSVRVLASYTDGAGTFESRASTATVPVIALALPPAGTDKTITTNEDTSYAMKLADFGFVAGTPGDTLSAVRIDTLPGNGNLTLAGLAVQTRQVIAATDITDGKLKFAPAANANGVGYATVGFSVKDQKDNFDASPNTLTLNVTEVNDAPTVGMPISDQTVPQGKAFSYLVPQTSFTDVDAGDALTYKAMLSTGAALPSWLTFNASTRTFSGTASATGDTTVRVIATDKAGASVSDDFVITSESADQVIFGTDSNDQLLGGIGNDTLFGGMGNDRLDGSKGADKLIGQAGNDTYVVDNGGDLVIEAASEGIDSVLSSVTYTLAINVENLTLTGTARITGRGNALANTITGNAANNTLNGGAGNDTLDGAAGADNLLGGEGNDTLIGGLGNDRLDGGEGVDRLTGGAGDDTYLLGRGSGVDLIREDDVTPLNTDTLVLGAGVDTTQLWFVRKNTDLQVSIIGTQDTVTIENWYSGKAYQIEQFKTADGKLLLNTQVDALVSAMAAFSPPSAGQTTLATGYQTALHPVIAANWK